MTSGECPPENAVYAYANSLQRTVATAQFFITGAFPGCGIPVHHQPQMGTMDLTFNPVITDDSPAFREKALQAMEKSAGNAVDRELQAAGDDDRLPQLALLQREEGLFPERGKDTFSAGYQQEPGVSGPLKVGNSLVDAFTLQYYEGFPKDQVAWGDRQR